MPRLNNQYPPFTEENGLMKNPYQSSTVEHLHASERKQVLMGKTLGVFSESINSKKLNNSWLQNQRTLGKCTNKWWKFPNNSCKLLSFHIRLSILCLELWMMQLPKSMICRHGSQAIMHTGNSYLAPTVLISNLGIYKSDVEIRKPTTKKKNMYTCLMELYAQLKEHYVAS